MRLKDKVAIVTGGAHGMGEAEARLFATEGAKVVVADILEHEAEMVAADIRAGGQEAIATKIDVTSEPEWVGLIAKAMATYGKLDILVNDAGLIEPDPPYPPLGVFIGFGRPHPEQGYRACLGILRLARQYSSARMEAAYDRGLDIGAPFLQLDPIDPQARARSTAG
jgi:NAD(P)-dependent dehydrogenase (short-subunit alcohol dehydrogenase family)